jgi:hypothetical protein
MKRGILITIAAVILLLPSAALAVGGALSHSDRDDGAPLENVVAKVHEALKQSEAVNPPCPRDPHARCFPPLKSIKLELNTTVGKSGGISLSFLIFTIGHTRSKESSATLTIELSRPASKAMIATLADTAEALAKAIVNAKKSYAAAAEIDPALTKGTVTLVFKFVISSETKGGFKVTDIIPVGLEGSGKYTTQQVHTITLKFEE